MHWARIITLWGGGKGGDIKQNLKIHTNRRVYDARVARCVHSNKPGGGESKEGYLQVSGNYSGEMGVREVFGDFCGEISTNVSASRKGIILRWSHHTCILYDKIPDA